MIHKLVAVLLFVMGFALMVMKIYEDSEPGAIPILLILLGVGWFLITRARTPSQQK